MPLHEFVSLFLLLGRFLLLCRLSTPPHLLTSFDRGTMADLNFSASTQVAQRVARQMAQPAPIRRTGRLRAVRSATASSGHGTMVDFTIFIAIASATARRCTVIAAGCWFNRIVAPRPHLA
ncbi:MULTISPECIES: hypothetical protein [unclassified Bradyrhizobium]|uniref:hypothetical protein n=1 Tax=unclassified Bradyrhizobium TaxID=2631580 RepID=UPI00143D3CBB|nr:MULTISPECIES: hypothetical protein [unclassified Bradyrhizobium]